MVLLARRVRTKMVNNQVSQEQLTRIAATVQSDLHLAEDQVEIIARYVKRAVNRILVFCFRPDLPGPLEDVAAQIVEDMLRYDQIAPTTGNDVASIQRGDTSISYRDKRSAYEETVSFVRDYEGQLIPFKRMKLPRDDTDDRS